MQDNIYREDKEQQEQKSIIYFLDIFIFTLTTAEENFSFFLSLPPFFFLSPASFSPHSFP